MGCKHCGRSAGHIAGCTRPPKPAPRCSPRDGPPCYGVSPMNNQQKDRECLRCRKIFSSEGPHNRLCLSCNRKNMDDAITRRADVVDRCGQRVFRKRIGSA